MEIPRPPKAARIVAQELRQRDLATIRDDSVLYLVVDRYESKLFVRLDTGEYELFGPDIVEYYEEVGDVRKDVDANDPDAIYDYLVKTVGAEVWSAYRECEGDEEDYRR